jgi:hypothetical protein
LLLDIFDDRLIFDREIAIDCDGYLGKMRLRGIIYGGQGHFTSRFVDVHGYMWFHDGITTGSTCLPEANLLPVSDPLSLHYYGEKKAVAVLYARVG